MGSVLKTRRTGASRQVSMGAEGGVSGDSDRFRIESALEDAGGGGFDTENGAKRRSPYPREDGGRENYKPRSLSLSAPFP